MSQLTAWLFSLYIVTATILLSHQVYSAPLSSTRINSKNEERVRPSNDLQEEIQQIILNGITNNTKSVQTIKRLFKQGTNKICTPITYQITCTDQPECENGTTSMVCETGYISTFIWTKFNNEDLPGQILFIFTSTKSTVPGFDWGGACVIDYQYNSVYNNYTMLTDNVPVLDIRVSALPCMDNSSSEVYESLHYITTLVSYSKIAQHYYYTTSFLVNLKKCNNKKPYGSIVGKSAVENRAFYHTFKKHTTVTCDTD